MNFRINKISFLIALFFFLVFFFPTKYYLLYHLSITIPLVLIAILNGSNTNSIFKIIVFFLLFILLSSAFRFFFQFDNYRDFFEIYRYIPVLILSAIALKNKNTQKIFISIAVIFLIVNGAVSILQILFKNGLLVNRIVSIIYNSEKHYNLSLLIANRALGLMRGPGDNAAVNFVVMLLVFFYSWGGRFTIIRCVAIVMGTISVVLSQSQTVFVAMIVVILFLLIMKNLKLAIVTTVTLLFSFTVIFAAVKTNATDSVSMSSYVESNFQKDSKLYYLSTLFTQGTDRSSYTKRLEKRDELLEIANKKPEWFVIGWGKSYLGEATSSTDNEHLYIFLVYGLVSWLSILIFLFSVSFLRTLDFLSTGNNQKLLVPAFSLSWVIIAMPSAFFTNPLILVCTVIVALYENKFDSAT